MRFFPICWTTKRPTTTDSIAIFSVSIARNLDVSNLMLRGQLFLEDSDWKRASMYFDRVLDINAKCAPAYIGLLCAELEVQNEEMLGDEDMPFSEYNHFQKAVRFAEEGYKAKIEEYDKKIRERIRKAQELEERQKQHDQLINEINTALTESDYQRLAEQCAKMGHDDLANECDTKYHAIKMNREDEERIQRKHQLQEQYDNLVGEMKDASTESDYQRLAKQFSKMDNYKDTAKLASECDNMTAGLKWLRKAAQQGHEKVMEILQQIGTEQQEKTEPDCIVEDYDTGGDKKPAQ